MFGMPTHAAAVAPPLSPAERRARNREEMVEAIVAAARAVMQERGVAALNLNEVARRVRLRPQSMAEYFPSKSALYDALYLRAYELFRAGDHAAYGAHPPGWDQIAAWFANRIDLADANPDLYHLVFDAPAPDYVAAERVLAGARDLLAGTRRMVAEAMAAGSMDPAMSVERAADLLLAFRRGLVAERLGKRQFFDPAEARFEGQAPDAIRVLRAAWEPANAPDGKEGAVNGPP